MKLLIGFSITTLFLVFSPGEMNKTDLEIKGLLFDLVSSDKQTREEAFEFFDKNWKEEYAAPFIDLLLSGVTPRERRKFGRMLKEKTGQKFGSDPYKWWTYIWQKPATYGLYYADFKAEILGDIDIRFKRYFEGRAEESIIRLDEILWGGVVQDGIPPLRNPKMLLPSDASYLDDEDIVFGIQINGEARAYPQRILGWHEMVVDKIGGKNIAGVYCALCGTMIAYDTKYNDVEHRLGTSGFLYRSNKLMYDQATQSLWNTIKGEPVVGPLVGRGIELKSHPVVTTTWGNWRKIHPGTLVLDINTGYRRNYDEGEAYRNYYATDNLMFPVPSIDTRLPNKEEVLVIKKEGYQKEPLAISTLFLADHSIYYDTLADDEIVVLTDEAGASKVYISKGVRFSSFASGKLLDASGQWWKIGNSKISNVTGTVLEQLPSHNIFWFAWYNSFPDTRLVK